MSIPVVHFVRMNTGLLKKKKDETALKLFKLKLKHVLFLLSVIRAFIHIFTKSSEVDVHIVKHFGTYKLKFDDIFVEVLRISVIS